MSDALSPAVSLGAQPVAAPVKEGVFHSILDHLEAFFGIAVKDVAIYEPRMVSLAESLFPSYAGMIAADQAIAVGVTTTIKNTVLTIEQKYSDATKNATTNAQKLEDAVAITAPTVIPTLQALKVPVPSTLSDLVNKINAVVAVAKTWNVPVATPNAQGT